MSNYKKIAKVELPRKTMWIDEVINYEFNNKEHGEKKVDLLANIIDRFWFTDEPIVDQNNILIAGHGRILSLKKMWYDAVEVKVMDIDSKDSKAMRLLHNKISEFDTVDNHEWIVIDIWELWSFDIWWVSMVELYPEYDAPEYDPTAYEPSAWWEEPMEWNGKITVEVIVEHQVEADTVQMLLKDNGFISTIK